MREIKFRAWAKHQNTMYSPEEMSIDGITIDPNNRGLANIHGRDNHLNEYDDHEKFILMQSIGLKNKNGVEIFEGDIIDVGFSQVDDVPILREVCFDTDTAAFLCKDPDEKRGHDFWFDGVNLFKYGKVYGNIHENPELLK